MVRLSTYLLLFSMLFVALPCLAQDFPEPYQFPTEVPGKYYFDPVSEYQDMRKQRIPRLSQKETNRFYEQVVCGKSNLFTQGGIYVGWDEAEDYLNDILERLIPEEHVNNPNIRVYLTYDADVNAFALHDGTILFNVGLLAQVEDEAAIALILAHELVHFLEEDVKSNFMQLLREQRVRSNNFKQKLAIQHSHQNRQHELRCDSVGFFMANAAGYDVQSMESNFLLMLREEERYEDENRRGDFTSVTAGNNSKKLDELLEDHPDTKLRIEMSKRLIQRIPEAQRGRSKFVVSQEHFLKLQAAARLEVLEILLSQFTYRDCIERAFIFHLEEPDQPVYLYYLLETIRRKLYADPESYQRGFLSDKYEHFLDAEEGVLHNVGLVFRSQEALDRVQRKEVLNPANIPFETYPEAFEYFSENIMQSNYPEMFLTMGLYHWEEPDKKEQYLDHYLNFPNAKYRAFAIAYRSNTLISSLHNNTRELVLMGDVSFKEYRWYGLNQRLLKNLEQRDAYMNRVQLLFEDQFPDMELINVNELAETNLNRSVVYSNALTATYLLSLNEIDIQQAQEQREQGQEVEVQEDKKPTARPETIIFDDQFATTRERVETIKFRNSTNLFRLDPAYWVLFKEEGLRSIDFLNVEAFSDKTSWYDGTLLCFCLDYYSWLWLYAGGSLNHSYELSYYSYSPIDKMTYFYGQEVEYKLNKSTFANSVYHAIKPKNVAQ